MEFQLKERVALLAGPLSTTTQALLTGLTGEGADVALLDPQAKQAERFCNQLTDQREIKAKHGRALAVTVDFSKSADLKKHVGDIAQSFGGTDILIDAQLCNQPTPISLESQEVELGDLMQKNLQAPIQLTQAVLGYLKSRKKGRIIYLVNDCVLKGWPADALQNALRSGLIAYSQSLAKQVLEHNITVNVVSLGLTEEYLMAHYPGVSIKEAVEKHKALDPFARITEPDRITNSLVYLAGPAGAAITGQTIRLV
jgi:NAD(P)-dependent dehydrogenase (short-subunit alcohol dehydrogenase family)